MLASAGSTTNRSMSLSLVICPVAADPNRMILSGRATVRTRRTTSFSSVSSTFIQFHHTQSRSQLHEKTLARAWCGRKTAVAKNSSLPAVHYRIPPGHAGHSSHYPLPVIPSARWPRSHSLSNSKCNPSRTAPAAEPLNLPVHSTSSALSTVRICDTFTTLAFGRLASPFFRSTLPGAFALLRFEVITHTTLVAIALRLKISFWTTTQGCRSPGAEPAAGPKSSQYTCPC